MSSTYLESDEYDRELNLITSRRFIGNVRVKISSLDFVDARGEDRRIVEGLKQTYQKQRCRRYDSDNYIPVRIAPNELRKALKASGLRKNDLKSPSQDGAPRFLCTAPNQKLSCLQGLHRIKAAEEFFNLPEDRWWIVKLILYRSESEKEKVTAYYKDQFSHQTGLSGGEIYRRVRNSQNPSEKEYWMAYLSDSMQVGLNQLLNRDDLTERFDRLLRFTALIIALEIGNIQRHLASGCYEVLILHFILFFFILNESRNGKDISST